MKARLLPCLLVSWLSACVLQPVEEGDAGTSSTGGGSASGGGGGGGGGGGSEVDAGSLPHFSFFVTSLAALQAALGQPGRASAAICASARPGRARGCAAPTRSARPSPSGACRARARKPWRAFLSADDGRRRQRRSTRSIASARAPGTTGSAALFALSKADLLADRPASADAAIKNDFPNEDGVPNHAARSDRGGRSTTTTRSPAATRRAGSTATTATCPTGPASQPHRGQAARRPLLAARAAVSDADRAAATRPTGCPRSTSRAARPAST